jgi:hypothetical protein
MKTTISAVRGHDAVHRQQYMQHCSDLDIASRITCEPMALLLPTHRRMPTRQPQWVVDFATCVDYWRMSSCTHVPQLDSCSPPPPPSNCRVKSLLIVTSAETRAQRRNVTSSYITCAVHGFGWWRKPCCMAASVSTIYSATFSAKLLTESKIVCSLVKAQTQGRIFGHL